MALRKDNMKKFVANRELARKIASKGGFYIKDAALFLDSFEAVLIEELMAGNRVLIKGVCSLEIVCAENRPTHDPRNGRSLGNQDVYKVLGRGSIRLARYYKIKKDREKKEALLDKK